MRGRSSDYQLIRSKCHEKFAARQFQESMIDDTPPQRLKNIPNPGEHSQMVI
jgi:hypothetical protein